MESHFENDYNNVNIMQSFLFLINICFGNTLRSQIMKLNSCDKSDTNYAILWAALMPTLSERPHKVSAWAELGIKEYYYIHEDAEKVSNSTKSSTGHKGKSSGKGKGNMMADEETTVAVEVINPDFVDLNNAKKIAESAQKAMGSQIMDMKKLTSAASASGKDGLAEDIRKITVMITEIDGFLDTITDDIAIASAIDPNDSANIVAHKDKILLQNVVAEATFENNKLQ